MTKSSKTIKVQGAFYSGQFHPHPKIYLAGKYLRHFGFSVGDTVTVTLSENRIVIEKKTE